MTRRVVATVALTAALTITPTVAAFAGGNHGGGHTPIVVCHNVTHNPHIIVVDDDSTKLHAHLAHRDQSQLMDLVEGYDGTADQIRAACVPKPSPTTPAPSPTTSHPTPTETTPCPSSTSTTPAIQPTTSTTSTSTSPTSSPPPSTTTPTSPATSPERPVKPTAPTTGRRSSPSTTSAPPPGELAYTGSDLSDGFYVGLFILAVGLILGFFGWLLSRKPGDGDE